MPGGQRARALRTFGPGFPKARGRRLQSSSWCAQLSWAPTPGPQPTPVRTSGVSLGSRCPTRHGPSPSSQGSRVPHAGRTQPAVGGGLRHAPSPLWGSPVFLQGSLRGTWSPRHSPPREETWGPAGPNAVQAPRADRIRQVGQGPRFPQGSARCRCCTGAFLSPASPLGSLLLPHDALQAHAAHPPEWSGERRSKGSERPCILSGLATFLHCACTAHADGVVNQWASDVESSSHRAFLCLHSVWMTCGRLIRDKITSTISMA